MLLPGGYTTDDISTSVTELAKSPVKTRARSTSNGITSVHSWINSICFLVHKGHNHGILILKGHNHHFLVHNSLYTIPLKDIAYQEHPTKHKVQ